MYFKACPTCGNTIPVGDLAVFAPKVDDSTCWHPSCFTCSYCNEHLVDLTYCKVKGTDLYCERHYAEKMKRRCAACDEVSWHCFVFTFNQLISSFAFQTLNILKLPLYFSLELLNENVFEQLIAYNLLQRERHNVREAHYTELRETI